MWAAAVEMLDRGVDVLATDSKDKTALDVLVERAQAMEIAIHLKFELESSGQKVKFVKQSRLYHETPESRRMLLDRFLSVC